MFLFDGELLLSRNLFDNIVAVLSYELHVSFAGRVRNHLQQFHFLLLFNEILPYPLNKFAPVYRLSCKESMRIVMRLLQEQRFLLVELEL